MKNTFKKLWNYVLNKPINNKDVICKPSDECPSQILVKALEHFYSLKICEYDCDFICDYPYLVTNDGALKVEVISLARHKFAVNVTVSGNTNNKIIKYYLGSSTANYNVFTEFSNSIKEKTDQEVLDAIVNNLPKQTELFPHDVA